MSTARQPSDAAVEAAAQQYWQAGVDANTGGSGSKRDWMRAALEAAYRVDAPRPLLDREAVHQAIADNVWPTVDGVEIIEAVPAVMELARPMPTREQIAQVLHDQNQVHAWDTNRCDDACGIAYYQRADAVLALLNGTES